LNFPDDLLGHDGRVVRRGQVGKERRERPLVHEANSGRIDHLDPVEDLPDRAPRRRRLLLEEPLERVLDILGGERPAVMPLDTPAEPEDERGVVADSAPPDLIGHDGDVTPADPVREDVRLERQFDDRPVVSELVDGVVQERRRGRLPFARRDETPFKTTRVVAAFFDPSVTDRR